MYFLIEFYDCLQYNTDLTVPLILGWCPESAQRNVRTLPDSPLQGGKSQPV